MPSRSATACLDEQDALDFVGGQSSPDERGHMHEHIAGCPECAQLVAGLARALGTPTLPGSTTRSATPDPAAVDELSAPLSAGTEIGPYRVVCPIAAGGMGVVYLADDPRLDRQVALKLLRADLIDPRAGRRLRREAQALARLNSPHVVTVHAAGDSPLGIWIAMDFIEGDTLGGWLSDAVRPWPEILDRFRAAATGLRDAHTAGIVHRDFKPSNVLLGDDGRVLVADFGLASRMEAPPPPTQSTAELGTLASTHATRTGGIAGTPAYMSPEQLSGMVADPRSDQFSFCVALYEGLYARRPYTGDSLEELLDAMKRGQVQRPAGGRAVPRWLHGAVLRGLDPSPERRYPSMTELLVAIDPQRHRSRMGRLALVGAVASVGAVAWATGHREPPSPCSDRDERLAAIWNDDSREAIATAFSASDDPGATRQLAAITQQLDARARTWQEADTRTCLAAQARSTPDRQLDLRFACLRTVLDETEVAVQALASADTDMVRRADTIMPRLTPVDRCEDAAYLDGHAGPELDPATAAAVEQLRRDAAQARTRRATSNALDVSIEELTALHQRAVELQHAPLQVSLANALGRALVLHDDPSAAIEYLEAGYFTAKKLGDHASTADAAIGLVQAVGNGHGRYDDAQPWIRHARAAARAAGTNATQGVIVGLIEGELLLSSQRYKEAEEVLQTAYAQLTPQSGLRRRASVAETLGNLYGAQWEAERALPYYEEALALHEQRVGPEHHDLLRALNGKAISLIILERLDAAAITLRRAIEIATAGGSLTARERIQLSNNLGALHEQRGELEQALTLYREVKTAEQERLGPAHEDTLLSLHNEANVLRKLKRCDASIEIATDLIDRGLSHQPPMTHAPLQGLWVLADCYRSQGRTELAISTLRRRIEVLQQHTPDDEETLANTRAELRALVEPAAE